MRRLRSPAARPSSPRPSPRRARSVSLSPLLLPSFSPETDSRMMAGAAGYTVDSTEGEREAAAPKEPAPAAAESEVPVATGDAPVTEEAAPAAAPEESAPPVGAAGAEQSEQPKREEAPQKKEEPKKKGGLFASCCGGSSKNYD